jgi:hypothetical protein
MLIVLKRADGERLWSADCNYKGGWELSRWVVNTPEEAGRLVTKRLKDRFVSDFTPKNKRLIAGPEQHRRCDGRHNLAFYICRPRDLCTVPNGAHLPGGPWLKSSGICSLLGAVKDHDA